MLKDYMGIITLNENEDNIKSLTKNRPLASIPIAGRYRIIDFTLSNLVNSGIQNVGIFTQSKTRSLVDHLGSGKPWDLDRKIDGLFVFNFGALLPYLNEVEMMRNNMEYFYQSRPNNIILTSSYMLCNIDYEEAAAFHEQSEADITIIYKKNNGGKKNFMDCDVLNIDENNRVTSVGKNIDFESENNISMEMFLMKKETLINLIVKCVKTGLYKTIKDAIYNSTKELNINAFRFDGYLQCINSINSYYKASMNLLKQDINKDLFFKNGPVYTKIKNEPPTRYGENSSVSNSLIANGCIIEGTVEDSIIFRKVKIGKGAVLKNCIIMQDCKIEDNAKLKNIIIDKNVVIESGKELMGDSEIPLVLEKRTLF